MDKELMQQSAKDHLWMHFTRMGTFKNQEVPIITHGEGCYVYDSNGKKYIDGLAGLFTSQIGHGRKEIASAVAEQIEKIGFFSHLELCPSRGDRAGKAYCRFGPGRFEPCLFHKWRW